MIFAAESRRRLGLLALLAPVPLPLNDVLEWPVLLLYMLLVAIFLRRSENAEVGWLPTWVLNLLALAYIPILLVDLQMIGLRGQVVQTVVHVCMFAVLVKLYSLRSEGDRWITLGTIFFLFLASMGTSVHPTVVIYLLLFLVLGLNTLIRFALFKTLDSFGRSGEPAPALPLGRFITTSTVLATLLAAPLFALFPRIQNPVVGVRGVGTGTVIHAAGFTDDVTLDSIGAQRDNPEVVLRLKPEGDLDDVRDVRLKGGAYDRYFDRRWWAAPPKPGFQPPLDEPFPLLQAADPPESWLDIWLQPITSRAIFLPVEATDLEIGYTFLGWNRGGALFRGGRSSGVLAYRVGLGGAAASLAEEPNLESPREPTLRVEDVSSRVLELAAEVTVGAVSERAKAEALERHLMREYGYSLNYLGPSGESPLEDFLFRYKEGHCELFASAMVMMLRARRVPARLVTGFLGADFNPLTGYYVVRQSNAHAWVEAYLPGEGWQIFDPTPAAGRPVGNTAASWSVVQQLYDYLQFRWDRYILTYGFQDQISTLWRLRSAWNRLRSWILDDGEDAEKAPEKAAEAATEGLEGEPMSSAPASPWRLLLFGLALAGVVISWWLRRARGLSATKAFQRLRQRLRRAGVSVSPATAPLALRRTAERAFPEVSEPAAKIIDFYLRESFGGYEVTESDHRALREALGDTRRALRQKPSARKKAS